MSDLRIEIFIGCHATYNDGYLFDKNYTITDTIELDDAIKNAEKHFLKCIKKARPEWEKEGYITDTYCEELYMADFEVYLDDVFIKLESSECFETIRNFIDIMDTDFSYPISLLLAIMENNGGGYDDLKGYDDDSFIFEVDSESDSDLSYGFLEISGGLDQFEGHDTLKQYFDHDSHGRDLAMEFTVYNIDNTYYAVSSN